MFQKVYRDSVQIQLFSNIFDPSFIESIYAEPMDAEGQKQFINISNDNLL